jgi:aryl-alcohol dehydrogenase-like predicted oxidoreductase
LKYRKFGKQGWDISEVGYGMWGMGGDWTGSDDKQSLESLQKAVELGCNFFDTAWAYNKGYSEKLLGQLVQQNSGKKLYTATKIPPKNFCWPSKREYALKECFPADHIEDYVARSLKNIGVEHLDVMQLHTFEDQWLDDDQWINKLTDLKKKGLIGAIGISLNRWEPWNGVAAVKSGLIDSVQVVYNIFDQNPEDKLFPACLEHDVAIIARVPFDEGTLTGTLTRETTFPKDDWRSTYFVPKNLNNCVDHAEALRPLIPQGMTMPTMAMRFILSNPDVTTVIPGMRKLKNVEGNIAASDAGPLDDNLQNEIKKHRWDRKLTDWS